MPRESLQHKLDRVRSPRVHITYDVEVGGAIEIKELPFVVGVLGDFTGQPEQPLPKLKERKFVDINPDNFDSVVEAMNPHLSFAVENKLSEDPDGPQLKVDLHFKGMDDFEPENIARQIKPLRELLDDPDLPPDGCLIVDQVMPGMAGLDVVDAIRRRGMTNPAILIVSNASPKVLDRAAMIGMAVIQKPFFGNELVDAIRDSLRH